MPEIFISYAWNDKIASPGADRETLVDQLCAALAGRGHTVRRDKSELGYKDDIRRFMERIGAGRYVVAVVSDKYLRSPFCMFEALEMLRHREFSERVFPIVLPDAQVFTSGKVAYSKYWRAQKDAFSKDLDEAGRDAASPELIEDERDLEEIRLRVQTFISEIARMNVLQSQAHLEDRFSQLIDAIEARMAQDNPNDALAEAPGLTPNFQAFDTGVLDFSHALRPEFTRSVAYTLFRERRSVNIHAHRGWGRHRLTDDLAHALRDAPVRLVRINLHNYISGYQYFLSDLAGQLRLAPGDPDFCDIIEDGCRKLGLPVLLILENMDAVLRENPAKDPRFNGEFLNKLNALRNGGFCRLLAVSEKAHNEYKFNGVSSWLDVRIMQLPELSDRHIGTEIDRVFQLDPALRTYIIEQVETEVNEPVWLLEELLRYLESNTCTKEAARHFILNYRKTH